MKRSPPDQFGSRDRAVAMDDEDPYAHFVLSLVLLWRREHNGLSPSPPPPPPAPSPKGHFPPPATKIYPPSPFSPPLPPPTLIQRRPMLCSHRATATSAKLPKAGRPGRRS